MAQLFFDSYCEEVRVPSPKGRAFVHYSCHLLLQRGAYDIPLDLLEEGISDGAKDGGIDAVYTLFNGSPLDSDSEIVNNDVPQPAKNGHGILEVVVIQTKMSGMGTTAVEKLIANLPRLMDLGTNPERTSEEFNETILERFEIARSAWRNLAVHGVELRFRVALSTMSDIHPINSETTRKIAQLERELNEILPGVSSVDVQIVAANQLIQLHRLKPKEIFELPYQRSLSSGSGNITLVRLKDYADFVDDGNGHVRLSLLDENIRDFQGEVAVNQAILESVANPDGTPFWWLNNGITLICKTAKSIGESIHVTGPKVVNGLQTTRIIHDYLAQHGEADAADQLVQVRILTTEDESKRDAITRSTNSQTAVDSASLRATDTVQRNIESYLGAHGFFYDRRKGSFREQQTKGETVVSIRDLGQALTAIVLARPDEARGNPSSLLKDEVRYKSIFNLDIPLDLYLYTAKWLEAVNNGLATEAAQANSQQRRYLKLHVLSAMVSNKVANWGTGIGRIKHLLDNKWVPADHEIVDAFRIVQNTLTRFNRTHSSTLEKATKAQGFTSALAELDWSDIPADLLAEIEESADLENEGATEDTLELKD